MMTFPTAAPTLPTRSLLSTKQPAPKKQPAPGLRIGDYLIGDDSCSNLFGHPDIRY